MASVGKTKEGQERAAEAIIEQTRRGNVPPRRLYMNGRYNKENIAKSLKACATLYGGKHAASLFPNAPHEGRPGFYPNNARSKNFVDEGPATPAAAGPDLSVVKSEVALDVIELMTKNNKLSKTKALEALDDLLPDHGLEAANKDVVIAALTKAQVDAATEK